MTTRRASAAADNWDSRDSFGRSQRRTSPRLLRGLQAAGYVKGDNVKIEIRWTEDSGRLPDLVAQLVQQKVTVLVAAKFELEPISKLEARVDRR